MRPIYHILAPFILALLLQAHLAMPLGSGLIIVLFLASTALAFIIPKALPKAGLLFVYLPFFLLGVIFISPSIRPTLSGDSGHISNFADLETNSPLGISIEAVVIGPVKRLAGDRRRLIVEASAVFPAPGIKKTVHGRIQLTIKSPLFEPHRNDRLRMLVKLYRPRNFENPGGFDYKWWLARKGIFTTGSVKNGRLIVKLSNGSGILRRIDLIREKVTRAVMEGGPASLQTRAILLALVTGDKSHIDKDTKEAFSRTGISHILAISGLHIGIVALFAYLLIFRLLSLSERLTLAVNIKKLSWLLALIPVVAYCFIAGFPLSAQRALIMLTAFVMAYLLNRSSDPVSTLALAGLGILIIDPGSLWDVSFQLSFTAVAGIILLVPRFNRLFENFVKNRTDPAIAKATGRPFWLTHKLRTIVMVTLSAQIATAPLTVLYFNGISLSGTLMNLIAVPVMTFIVVPLSLLSVLAMPLGASVSQSLLSVAGSALSPLLTLIETVSTSDRFWLPLSTPSTIEIVSLYSLIFVLFVFRRTRYTFYLTSLLVAVSIIAPAYNIVASRGSKELKVTFLSVAQSEASFIEFPGGTTMLIDGGTVYRGGFDIGQMVISPYLRKKHIRKIDYMVLSHAQLDHKGGLNFIAKNFAVGEFWYNDMGKLPVLLKTLKDKKTRIVRLNTSSAPIDINGVTVRVLNPPQVIDDARKKLDLNEGSLVLKLTYGKRSFLFTGDIGFQGESRMKALDIKADVLKAPHHGSKFSSSNEFLKNVAPSYVVVSAGYKNRFGFPNQETLLRYEKTHATLYRTDLHGAITISTDGEDLNAETFTERP